MAMPFDDAYRQERGPRARGGNEFGLSFTGPQQRQEEDQSNKDPFGYDDPFTRLLTTAATGRIAKLSQPFSDPGLDEVLGLIRGQMGQVQARPTGFSPDEESRLTTRAWDGLEQRRQAQKQNNLQEISRRGIAPSSGVLQELNSRTDRAFDADRTRSEADTNIWMSQEENTRRTAQQNQLMQLAGMLSQVMDTRRGEERSNENDILQIASMLSNLGPQRLALAMNVLNGTGGGDMSGLFNNTLNLSNSQQAANQNASANRQNFLLGLGQLIGAMGGGR